MFSWPVGHTGGAGAGGGPLVGPSSGTAAMMNGGAPIMTAAGMIFAGPNGGAMPMLHHGTPPHLGGGSWSGSRPNSRPGSPTGGGGVTRGGNVGKRGSFGLDVNGFAARAPPQPQQQFSDMEGLEAELRSASNQHRRDMYGALFFILWPKSVFPVLKDEVVRLELGFPTVDSVTFNHATLAQHTGPCGWSQALPCRYKWTCTAALTVLLLAT
jgi:hypothetical protein